MKRNRQVSQRIKGFRESHYSNQKGLADALGVGQTVVSAWERGDNTPSSEAWIKLASLAPSPDKLWFLEQAGLRRETIIAAATALGEGILVSPKEGDMVLIPRFRETRDGRVEAGPPITLPPEVIPNPAATIALVVDDLSTGVIESPRGIILVDTSWEGIEDLRGLWNRVVVLRCAGKTVPMLMDDYAGIYVGRLILGDNQSLPFSPGTAVIRASLFSLTGLSWALQDVGRYTEPDKSHAIPRDDTKALGTYWQEMHDRAASELHLFPGVRIVGKVIGRLTGHLEGQSEKR